MNATAKLFEEELSKVPDDVKIEHEITFSIAAKIDAALKEKNISLKELARKMGKTDAEVSRWLGGTHNFTVRTIAKISQALGISLVTV